MNWSEFVRRWRDSSAGERQGSQTHFNELCALLGEDGPNTDPGSQDYYAFEFGAAKSGGGDGFADVALKDHFGWEYKGRHKDLAKAYKQLLDYHEALGQPPLLVVSDMERFEVHTKWAQMESWTYRFSLPDLLTDDPVEVRTATGTPKSPHKLSARQVLKALFEDVERLKPNRPRDDITKEAAADFEKIAVSLRKWKDAKGEQLVDDLRIARLITKLIFCMFATDVGLLEKWAFSDAIRANRDDPKALQSGLRQLFQTMDTGGSVFGRRIPQFNGWLFADDDVPDELLGGEISVLEKLDAMNWTDVEPAIFGTLFERVLDKGTRAKLGAHYTSRDDIELLVKPVLMAPLEREWEGVRESAIAAIQKARDRGASEQTRRERLREMVEPFLERLGKVQVLDPACGSGNFLYVSLALLKRLEKEIIAFTEIHGVELGPRVHPRQLHGIEVNPYAHELASIVIWIGFLQWKYQNQIDLAETEPILEKLDQIQLKDAILDLSDTANPKEPEWPVADVIVGNPPFLGGNKVRKELGDEYVETLFKLYEGRVKPFADLCCYWHEKARASVEAGRTKRVGLLATQKIKSPASRFTLGRIKETGDLFFVESNRAWTLDGAAIRVAMIGFDAGLETRRILDGRAVEGINSNLTAQLDVTRAATLVENHGICFMGPSPKGPFDISAGLAAKLLSVPLNPNGRPNSDVVRPVVSGVDIVRRGRGKWTIDFALRNETEAALYQQPFEYLLKVVKPVRMANRRAAYTRNWWQYAEPRPGLRRAIVGLDRVLVTPAVSKHRVFAWARTSTLCNQKTFVFARADDYLMGVLHSKIHELWTRANNSRHGVGNDPTYTNTTCFETFPLPWPPGKEPWGDPLVSAIGEAAKELNELRERWLNPGALTPNPSPDPAGEGSTVNSGGGSVGSRMPLDVASPGGRALTPGPSPSAEGEGSTVHSGVGGSVGISESELKKRTLTNLYNERPQWLENAHRELDKAVFAAYGWDAALEDGDVLAKLLALNLERAGGG